MQKIYCIFLLGLILNLSGCATLDSTYYLNPNSPGYTQFAFNALCENCNRVFTFTGQQWYSLTDIQCCYCGHIQNLKMAHNRHNYLVQQQQNESLKHTANIFVNHYQEYLDRSYQKRKEAYQNSLQNLSQAGQQIYFPQQRLFSSDESIIGKNTTSPEQNLSEIQKRHSYYLRSLEQPGTALNPIHVTIDDDN